MRGKPPSGRGARPGDEEQEVHGYQIGKTIDELTRDRLYSLYGQEVERELMARNREQFGFRVIDSPRVPDRKSKPNRTMIAIVATLVSILVCTFILTVRTKSSISPRSNSIA
jgi:uncharacterized protein involved in exopolysaccharide biosynthesis